MFFILIRVSLLKLLHREENTHLSNLKICVSPTISVHSNLKKQQSLVLFERLYFQETLTVVDTGSKSMFELSRKSTSRLRFGFGIIEAIIPDQQYGQIRQTTINTANEVLKLIQSHTSGDIRRCFEEFSHVQFDIPKWSYLGSQLSVKARKTRPLVPSKLLIVTCKSTRRDVERHE